MDLTQQIMEVSPQIDPEVIRIIGDQIKSNTDLIYWVGGGLTALMFMLGGRIMYFSREIEKRVTYKWIEEQFAKKIDEDIKEVIESLHKIQKGLMGEMNEPGIVTRLHDVEKDVKYIKEKVKNFGQ